MHPAQDPFHLRAIAVGFFLSSALMLAALLAVGTGLDLIAW